MPNDPSELLNRSQRYEIEAPLQYRLSGERVWHQGFSRNMSDTGILFAAEAELSPGVRFEGYLILPKRSNHDGQTSIRFQAVVARDHGNGIWAARILARRLCRMTMAKPRHSHLDSAAAPVKARSSTARDDANRSA